MFGRDRRHVRMLRRAARLLPWSTWTRDSLIEDYGVDPTRIDVVPPGEGWTTAPFAPCFAVVADEVKQLAQETARATEDISQRVETIQADAEKAARAVFDGSAAELDYLVLTDPELGPAPARGPGRLLVAARVGKTRLIDNAAVEVA